MKNSKSNLLHRSVQLLGCAAALVMAGLPHAEAVAGPAADSSSESQMRGPEVFGYVQTFFQQAYHTGEDPDADNDFFRIQRLRLGVKGDINPIVSYDLEIDPRAPEVSGILRDAFIDVKLIPRHVIRIGQQKTPFGYENDVSSSKLYTVNRTELSESLGRGINLRDIGVSVRGNVKLGGGFRLEDAIAVVNGAGINVQADNSQRKNLWGRIGFRYKDNDTEDSGNDFIVRAGLSVASGDMLEVEDPDDPTDDIFIEFKRVGIDVQVEQRWLLASAEYAQGQDTIVSSPIPADIGTDEPAGWYYTLVGRSDYQVGPVVRFDQFDDDFKRWTVGAYYGEASAPVRVLLNYEYRQLRDGARQDDKLYLWLQVRF